MKELLTSLGSSTEVSDYSSTVIVSPASELLPESASEESIEFSASSMEMSDSFSTVVLSLNSKL